MNFINEIAAAHARIAPHVRETPLEHSRPLSALTGANVYLKLENLQHTGSFKYRGALNNMLQLDEAARKRGVITASTGNHGAACARAGEALGVPVTVFAPTEASPAKLDNMRQYGARLELLPGDSVVSELAAIEHARQHGLPYVSPYSAQATIAGQGTIALELTRQLDRIDAVFVTVGGGGLMSGIAGYLKQHTATRGCCVVGCQPRNSAVMYESIKAGRIVEMDSLPTLSDGSAGGIEPDAMTFDFVRQFVDEFALVSEAEIAAALRLVIEKHHQVLEGAAGTAVAALLAQGRRWAGKRVVVVACGGNISMANLRAVINGDV